MSGIHLVPKVINGVCVPHPMQGPKRYDHKWIWLCDSHSKGSCIISQGQAQNRNNLFLIFLLNVTLRRSFPTLKVLGTSPTGQHFPKYILKDTGSLSNGWCLGETESCNQGQLRKATYPSLLPETHSPSSRGKGSEVRSIPRLNLVDSSLQNA